MLDYLEDFLLRIQTNNYSPETLYNYERDLKTFENFLKNEIKIPFEKINKKTIEQYKAYLVSRDRKTALGEKSKQNLTSGSINRTLSSLRGYLKYLIKMDYDSPIAPESIELLKTKKKHYRVSEFEEIVKLIESPSQFEKNKIDKTGRIFIMGKGKKERFVYLTERAKKHLGNYLSTRTDDSPYLFIPYRGKHIKNKNKKISYNYLQEKNNKNWIIATKRISYSTIETFTTCPAKYKFQYLERIPAPKSKEAVFGSLIHEMLKMFHEPSRPTPLSEEELLKCFTDKWDPGVYNDQQEEAFAFHQGIEMLKNYYQENSPLKFNIVNLETSFEAPILDGEELHQITGRIDRIDKSEDGAFEVIDYKTAKKMPGQKEINSSLQLSLYHLGLTNP